MARPMRRNIAHLTKAERDAFVDAVRKADLQTYVDGVSYWDKQDQIHQGTHNHGGPSFIPWHRELCNRYERLLQQVDPDVALHYWDWTQDPRAADDGNGGTVDLTSDDFFGTASGLVQGVLAPLHNGDQLAGSRDQTLDPADPPRAIKRFCNSGAPGVSADATIITGSDALPQGQQWPSFRAALESSHNTAHTFFGPGSNIFDPHASFEDPFVFLLHSNVDRLFAMWQTRPGQEWRLDQAQVYGNETNSTGSEGILHNLQPWDGTVEFGSPIPPWTSGSTDIEVKNCRHASVVAPPCYDSLPVTVMQIAPAPGIPLRFLDVAEGEQTARALRLRVRGCRTVTCQAAVKGDAAFTLLQSTVVTPDPQAYVAHDVFVWVLFNPGLAGSSASGTLEVNVAETGDTFSIPIEANVIAKPTVASSMVLDRSGSMDAPSGVAGLKRIEVLRNSAPLFVHLLGDDDAVGVIQFDTDAAEAMPVEVAGGTIGGLGRANALNAISHHVTDPNGLTSIGDGLEAAAAQLGVTSGFSSQATVVFTDGFETAAKFIADVAPLITSRVFAVGLGTAEQLNPAALGDLVDSTGGYLLLTGQAGADDQIRLQKYYAQIIAGMTNSQIIVDPDGFVPIGGTAVEPYPLTEADSRSDVIVLTPYARALKVALEAPDRTRIDDTNGAQLAATANHRVLRLALPSPALPGPVGGEWKAHLSVDPDELKRIINELEERRDFEAINRIKTHGLPYTLAVQTRSAIRMTVTVKQSSRRPGGDAQIIASLAEAGIPLGHTVSVRAEVSGPDAKPYQMPLSEVADGEFTGTVPTPVAGVYRVLLRAEGRSLRGEPFTREELRTIAVWTRGDDRSIPRNGRA
ncbi:tyrosinase family protein [Nonomuraea basaltis]|uniref:tyrosinase family protein n=1 Tax=Nonomuraea basaltis TaxID=2495887 RepID=UPI00110C70B5|nr:tyrosinase family protein [Nonomuraea basaltis]TMR91067.1 VWA domain-containing protein [Nonomuraea basaltis]